MMLRNRTALSTKTNLPQQQTNGPVKAVDPPAKRAASKQLAPAKEDISVLEPKAKRAALNELTTKLSNGLVLDSMRKGLGIRKTEKLAPKAEPEDILEDELIDEKKEDPCPDYDYDSENMNDPYNLPEFAFDIFVYYRNRETAYAVGDYLKKQSKLSMGARAILVD
ncbi:hypothetical protein PRIPAC_97134 [Pristionchus pacificus]|nr:hypothetical protein PRIPAC_97134 [Pristionchus pacificus]